MEKEKFDVSVILPIHTLKHKDFDILFDRAIKSLQIQSVDRPVLPETNK